MLLVSVDVKLPFTFETCVQNGLLVLAHIVVIAVVFPWFILAAIPIFLVFLLFVSCFRAGIRAYVLLTFLSPLSAEDVVFKFVVV